MDQTYAEGSTKKGQEHPYAKRYREEIDRLQKQYDERVKEIETKIRQKKRSVIETEIVRLQATLAALRQPQGGPPEPAAPATSDAKAIQGTWEIVSSTFSLIDRLPGGENVSDERVRKSTKIVITADTFRVMGKYVFNRAFDYQLNPETKPKIIDFQFQNDTNVYLGIFQVSGNELKICATHRAPAMRRSVRRSSGRSTEPTRNCSSCGAPATSSSATTRKRSWGRGESKASPCRGSFFSAMTSKW